MKTIIKRILFSKPKLVYTIPIPIPTYINLPLLETSGTVAKDISGNSRDATYVACVLDSGGVILNQSSSLISLNLAFPQLNSMTVSLDFKAASIKEQGLWEFNQNRYALSGTYTPTISLNGTGQVGLYGYPLGYFYASEQNTDGTFKRYDDNIWHKIVMSANATNTRVFVDGKKIINASGSSLYPFTGYFVIGQTWLNQQGKFSGQMKNFKVFNFALSDSQIASL